MSAPKDSDAAERDALVKRVLAMPPKPKSAALKDKPADKASKLDAGEPSALVKRQRARQSADK